MSEVICHHCHQPIENKDDLLVMIKWWLLPRPLHKQCWGDLFMSKGGAGTVSFGTGVFQNRRRSMIPVNSLLFTGIVLVTTVIALFLLLVFDPSGGTVTTAAGSRAPTTIEGIFIKFVLGFLFLIPLLQRIWSYSAYESKFNVSRRASMRNRVAQ